MMRYYLVQINNPEKQRNYRGGDDTILMKPSFIYLGSARVTIKSILYFYNYIFVAAMPHKGLT